MRIDQLNPTAIPTREHYLPAMKDGLTVKLSTQQVADLLINGAPTALNDLKKISDALGGDGAFSTKVVLKTSLDTDAAFTSNSDTKVPSQKAVKTAVDGKQPSSILVAPVTLSGAFADFLNIPAGVRKITVQLDGPSFTGTDDLLIQLGTASGVETSNYTSGSASAGSSVAGFNVRLATAARVAVGHMFITNHSGNVWIASHSVHTDSLVDITGAGRKTLAGPLTRLRVAATGSNTFDGGSVSLLLEF